MNKIVGVWKMLRDFIRKFAESGGHLKLKLWELYHAVDEEDWQRLNMFDMKEFKEMCKDLPEVYEIDPKVEIERLERAIENEDRETALSSLCAILISALEMLSIKIEKLLDELSEREHQCWLSPVRPYPPSADKDRDHSLAPEKPIR